MLVQGTKPGAGLVRQNRTAGSSKTIPKEVIGHTEAKLLVRSRDLNRAIRPIARSYIAPYILCQDESLVYLLPSVLLRHLLL
jgi:hypothetical protein